MYLALALGCLAVIAAGVFVGIKTGFVIPRQWVALALFTGGLLFAMIKTYQRYWRRLAFWLALAGLLGIHLVVFFAILQHFPEFRPIWYVPAVIAEGAAFGIICGALLDGSRLRRGG